MSENIFEFLGLDKDHRENKKKTTQLVKNYEEVSDKHKDKAWLAQIKADGDCSLTVVYKGKVGIFSRTAKKFTNVESLEVHVASLDILDGIYLSELTCKGISLEVLSGLIGPNRKKPVPEDQLWCLEEMKLELFDYVSIGEFMEGETSRRFLDRFLTGAEQSGLNHSERVSVIKVMAIPSEKGLDQFFKEAVAAGEEGIIIRDPEAGWEAGHKGWRVMKMVRGVSYDLECVGLEEGKGKYKGLVANLFFKWKDGVTLKCMPGKGWTHEACKLMWDEREINSPVGQIFEVYALQESSKGKLRNPKVGEHRHDKDEADV